MAKDPSKFVYTPRQQKDGRWYVEESPVDGGIPTQIGTFDSEAQAQDWTIKNTGKPINDR
jgi:hypothetical protein